MWLPWVWGDVDLRMRIRCSSNPCRALRWSAFARVLRFFCVGMVLLSVAVRAASSGVHVQLPAAYLPGVPMLVRVEVTNEVGQVDRDVWDGQALLTVDAPGVVLSTNMVWLRNGLGCAQVTVSGTDDFTLTCAVNGLSAERTVSLLTGSATNQVSGLLAGGSTTWSGVVHVTGDVTVPVGHTLTIEPGTWVLMDGVAAGSGGADIEVDGTMLSLGTEAEPVVITASDGTRAWGEIRHQNAQPSVYRQTMVTAAGHSPGVGHTGSGPAFRPTNSRLVFEECSVSYNAGKIMYATGSDLAMTNCVMSRSIMGPEISGTSLVAENCWFMEMFGPDDDDGIYLWNQQQGQVLYLTGCVFAYCDDDTVDNLNSRVTYDHCIMRNAFDKGISQISGQMTIRKCLIADCAIGVSIKGQGSEVTGTIGIDRTTISARNRGIAMENKFGISNVSLEYYVTNSIIRATAQPGNSVYTDYDPGKIHIYYSDVGTAWAGTGNLNADPLFLAGPNPFYLQASSPCVDAGDPSSAPDPDGTRADMGVYPLDQSGPMILENIYFRGGRACVFTLLGNAGQTVRDRGIRRTSSNGRDLRVVTNTTGSVEIIDPGAAPCG